MRKLYIGARRKAGVTSIAELGPSLWIVFTMVTFPLLSFGTLGMRYCFVNNAVNLAAEEAAQSNTFSANQDASHLSAINTANLVIGLAALKWNGISVSTTATSIVISSLSASTVTSQQTPLTTAQMLTQSGHVYTCQVAATVSLQPLFPQTYLNGSLLSVPGLNAPIVTTVVGSRFFENPSGLNK